MDILDRINRSTLTEAKATVSPLLKSVMDKQTAYSEQEVQDIIKKIGNNKASLSVTMPYSKGGKYVLVNDDDKVDTIAGALSSMGYKITDKKKDGGKVFIYFK